MTYRLKHPSLRDVNFTVVHSRRYKEPLACLVCDEIHTYKTYHLRLDSQGEVEVSDVIYERLAELEGLPLTKVSKVRKPTPQTLVMPPAGGYTELERPHTERFVPKSMRDVVQEATGG